MLRTALVLGLLGAVAAGSAAFAANETYKATLSGASEVPPVQSNAQGTATVTVNSTSHKVTWQVRYSGLSGPAVAAHIHCGAAAGANAPVAVPLGKSPHLKSPIHGSGTMSAAQFADLQSGKCYVNLHTTKNPNGEARGQLEK